MLAVDHGYFMGPTHKLEEPRKTIEPLLPYSDAIMCTRGILRTSVNPKSHVPIVLRVSGGASVVGESLTNETITTSFREAVRLNVALACRIAAEIGAHFVKTYYCEDFAKVVKGCPVPLVVAGGPKLETELDAFELAHEAVSEGAVGVDMGRNIWQSEHPVAMIKAIREIVHDGASVREAQRLYESFKKAGSPLLAKTQTR